jgi:hypothetical protein
VAPVFSDRERLDASPSSGESMYAFLDRAAGPVWYRVRQLIEAWANDYSPDDRADLVRRLQSRDDLEFTAAYWELLLFHGLKALGFEVTCHPEVAGTTRRPDFLAEGNACSFYLEAKVLGDDHARRMRDKRRAYVEDGLNARVRSDDFFVQVQFGKEGVQHPPISKLAAAVRVWLGGLDVAEVREEIRVVGLLGVRQFIWEDERTGWSVALAPMPKSGSGGGERLVVMRPDAAFIDDVTPIRRSLYQKAHKYGDKLDKPFVVALGILRPFVDDTDLVDTLFGDYVYLLDPSTGDGKSARRSNGLVIGPMGPQSRRLSAVLVGNDVAPWSAAETKLALWKNPWATHPIRCDAGGVLTMVEPQNDGSLATTPAAVRVGDLIGLPPDWPGPEPAFA